MAAPRGLLTPLSYRTCLLGRLLTARHNNKHVIPRRRALQLNAGFATFNLTSNVVNRTVLQSQQSYCAPSATLIPRSSVAEQRTGGNILCADRSSAPLSRAPRVRYTDFYVFMDGGFEGLAVSRILRW